MPLSPFTTWTGPSHLALPQLPARPTCTACSLHTVATSVGISTRLLASSSPPSPSTTPILLLGQNPGHNEDVQNTPFIGPSGDLLLRIYVPGIRLDTLGSVYVSNICRCFHVHGKGPTNRHYSACRPHLLHDLHAIAALHAPCPSLYILCLGAPATSHLYALLGVRGVTLTSSFSHQGRRLSLPPFPPPETPPCEPKPEPEPDTATETPSPSGAAATRALLATSTVCSATRPAARRRGRTRRGSASPAAGPTTPPTTAPASGAVAPPAVDCLVFSTYHPAAVLRQHSVINAVQGHLQTLLDSLTGRSPVITRPRITPTRYPAP